MDKDAHVLLKKLLTPTSIQECLVTISNAAKGETFLEFLFEKQLGVYNDFPCISQFLPALTPISSSLSIVWIELRKACNLKCKHCYANCSPKADEGRDLLSVNDWEAVLRQLPEFGIKSLVFIGGEPFLYPELYRLLSAARRLLPEIRLVVYSNLTLITDDFVALARALNIVVVTSLYSFDPSTHDGITGIRGSWQKTVSGVECLKRNAVAVFANTVIMRDNQNDVQRTVNFISELSGRKPKVDVVRCTDDAKLSLKPESSTSNHVIKGPIFKPVSYERLLHNMRGNSCWQGKLNISCDGYVSPCIMAAVADNIRVTTCSLKNIVEQYLVTSFWAVSRDRIPICKDCEYRYVCFDCRPLSLSDVSQPLRGDTCTYNPYDGSWSGCGSTVI